MTTIQEKLASGYYEVKEERPPVPKKPVYKISSNQEESDDYFRLLNEYEKKVKSYNKKIEEIRESLGRKKYEFMIDSLKEVGYEDHPKAIEIFHLAWRQSNSRGFCKVFNHLQDLVQLFS